MTHDELAAALLATYDAKKLAHMLAVALAKNGEVMAAAEKMRDAPLAQMELHIGDGGRRAHFTRGLGDAIVDLRSASSLLSAGKKPRNLSLSRRLMDHVALFERAYAYLRKKEETPT